MNANQTNTYFRLNNFKKYFAQISNITIKQKYIFILVFCCFFVYLFVKDTQIFFWDSLEYWRKGDGMFAGGKFDLYNFPETFRGYVVYLLISFSKVFGQFVFSSEYIGFWLFTALYISITLCITLPYIFNIKINSVGSLLKLSVAGLLILYFWGDYLQYPASDAPAMVFMLAGAALLKYTFVSDNNKKWTRCISAFVAGMCLYAAYNTRVAYLFGVVAVLVMILVFNYKRIKLMLKIAPCILVGCILLALPQMLINYHYTEKFTPRVLTEAYTGYERTLQATQVYWGLTYLRYEGVVGNVVNHSFGGAQFVDSTGLALVEREGITSENFTYGTFFNLLAKYPLDMCSIYARHFVGLLTPIYPWEYIYELFCPKGFRISFAIVLWLIAAIYAIWLNKEVTLKKQDSLLLFAACMPCLLQLFGAPEIRFFITIHFLLYFFIAFCVNWQKLWQFVKINHIKVLIPCVVIFFAWTTIIADTLQACTYEKQLINDYPKTYTVQEVVYSAEEINVPNSEKQTEIQIIDFPVSQLMDNTMYQISFDLNINKNPQYIYFDIVGSDYGIQFAFQNLLKKGDRNYSWVINSGTIPEDAVLRLVYATEQEYTIENFELSVVVQD